MSLNAHLYVTMYEYMNVSSRIPPSHGSKKAARSTRAYATNLKQTTARVNERVSRRYIENAGSISGVCIGGLSTDMMGSYVPG